MKNVVVDFSHIGAMCGFGEISRNYCPRLAAAKVPGIHFIFIVPRAFFGKFGDHIDYVSRENKEEEMKKWKGKIDLWHATDQLFKYRMRGDGIISLLTIHDLNYLKEKKGVHRIKHIFKTRWRSHCSDYITCISNYVKDEIVKNINPKGKGLQVIYNGIQDIEKQKQSRPAFVAEGEKFFFTIGQVREKKNFHTLVPMMKYFPDMKLYICGDPHFKYVKSLQALVDAEGCGRVVLTGKISDEEKNWMYAHAEAFLFPSRLEGFGIPVLEAMRLRCKVFSSRYSSLPEVCSSHATYWDDYSPESMAKVVADGIATWQRDGKEADEAYEYSRGFSYDEYTRQYIELYTKLLAEGK
ncbi:MAG: glycosyltransferase family 4 protein [Prevotella sp.]|nr:glycosyltransferase family 4 protein [Prevotella sp.]